MKERPKEGSFMKNLKLLDRRLDCYLNRELSKRNGMEPLYVIEYDSPRGPVILHVVHDGFWNYREPNKNDIEVLASGDCEKQSLSSQLDEKCRYLDNIREEQARKTDERISEATKDHKYQLADMYNRIHGSGKGAKHVRSITPKETKKNGFVIRDSRKLSQEI